jgi:peptidoglycan hydrolase CwlO-like protein
METKLEKLERLLKDEQQSLEELNSQKLKLELLIMRQQEIVWKCEEELEEEKSEPESNRQSWL